MAIILLKAPTTLALFLHLLGCSIFSPLSFLSPEIFGSQLPSHGPSPPLLATAIVNLGIAILLSQYSLWPSTLRKPPKPLLFLIQLLFALFVHEFTLNVIWYPLEGLVYDMWHYLALMANNPNVKKQKNMGVCCEFFRALIRCLACTGIPGIASYIMSLAFLGCILHITKIQDVYKNSC